ncbi:MAG: flagellar biosynthetic protein FliP [Leptolyngbya sp. PLA3]|nr:MAG: flagellar biosynthetic protein FliP [Cyanobacteria bacterium CYA]MCE7968877.1 flagellar biosynthetic protein FliP [Leptolyngbya sp. PL-A3]
MAQPVGPFDEPAAPAPRLPSSVIDLPASPAQINPLQVMADASAMLDAHRPQQPDPSEKPGLSVAVNVMLLLTVITLVPSIMLMTTCFVRILVVLALLRQALGTQSLPPPQVVTGLALFMTLLVMSPTIDRIWNEAVVPYQNGEIGDYDTLWAAARQPMRDYMFDQIEATGNWSSVYTLLNYRGVDTSNPAELTRADVDMVTLVPAYMLSELKVAFLLGFRVYLPFLVIDMVIASLLISMSMMMLPPVLISLPFKLLLFVLVDGWALVVGSLLETFVQEGTSGRLSAEPAAMLPFLLICFVRRPRPPVSSLPLAEACRDV